MTYYHLPTASERNPRPGEQTIDTGQWITPYNGQWTDAEAALCGFLPIVEPVAPTPGPDEVAEAAVALVDGLPVRQWTVRPKTADELATTLPGVPGSADVLAAIKAQPTVTKRVDALLAALEAGTLVL